MYANRNVNGAPIQSKCWKKNSQLIDRHSQWMKEYSSYEGNSPQMLASYPYQCGMHITINEWID